MGFVDKAMATFFPVAHLKNEIARVNLQRLHAYESLAQNSNVGNWRRSTLGPNAVPAQAANIIRQQADDLVRNNTHARKFIYSWQRAVGARSIRPRPVLPEDKLFRREVVSIWNDFGLEADSEGALASLGAALRMVSGQVPQRGEIFIRRRWRTRNNSLPVPLQLQFLEPEYLDETKNEDSRNSSGRLVRGIEYNNQNRPVAYHMFREHPNDAGWQRRFNRQESFRIPARDIIHVFDPDRFGQKRGISRFAPVITRLLEIGDYVEAEIARKRLEACLSVWMIGAPDMPVGLESDAHSNIPNGQNELRPGVVHSAPHGAQLEFFDPKANNTYPQFLAERLRAVAAGLGISYESLTGDLSEVNYSSLRFGNEEFKGIVADFQSLVMIDATLRPIWNWFYEALELIRPTPAGTFHVDWQLPRWASIDPLKDAQTDKINSRLGVQSMPQIIGEQGGYWEDTLDEIEEWQTEAAARRSPDGIILESDPGHELTAVESTQDSGSADNASENRD